MGVRLTVASSQSLRQAPPPFTTLPATMGFWFNTTTVAAGTVNFSSWQNAAGTDYAVGRSAATPYFYGGAVTTNFSMTLVANAWYFVLQRFVSASSKRASILGPDGVIVHIANTDNVSVVPTMIYLGMNGDAATLFDGSLAGYFLMDVDVQPDGVASTDSLVRQLAHRGPFSIPQFASRVVEYQSFLSGVSSHPKENYYSRYARQIWAVTGGFSTGLHPPAMSKWVQPPGRFPSGIVSI